MLKRFFFIFALILISIEITSCNKEDDWIVNDIVKGDDDIVKGDDNIVDDEEQDKEVLDAVTEYIAIFGDIQYYTNPTYIQLYKNSVDWIYRQKQLGIHINCVLHTGDVTQGNSINSWQLFYDNTLELASVIPFITMIGDHDYTWDDARINDRLSTHFNDFVSFPLTVNKVVAWFEEGRMENIVVENTIHGQRIDFLILEFGPRVEVVEWADKYVKSHPDVKFIMLNHEYLEAGGGRRTTGLKCERRIRNSSYTTPEQLWEKLIKCNDNIRCVLCGHVGGLYAYTEDINDFGRIIPQIQHNIQGPKYRYDNWLMLWEIPANEDIVKVSVYNTQSGMYFDDKRVLFDFKLF